MDKNTILKQYFGHDTFRPGQESIIDAILSGRDALAVMPTGGGKSLCYQIPALLLPGVTLVVSPLISLMKDQVTALAEAGVPAAYINSSLSPEQLHTVYRNLRRGDYKLVYVAPERLTGEGFSALFQSLNLALLAVDEAHCISQWGQDFRPSYLKIAQFLSQLPRRPILAAFTATATDAVRQDILKALSLQNPFLLTTGFDRPNLYFDVQQPSNRLAALRRILAQRRGKSGIVYCATRTAVDRVCADLNAHGFSATRYHAGLTDSERRQNQEDFQYDRKTVMVATNAFGMGIDKSNVSFVIHYNMPKSMEAYYQEAGRAGRDGEAADCILLYGPSDIVTAKALIEHSSENDALDSQTLEQVRRQDLLRLNAMVDYCKSRRCFRGVILDYFGQAHGETCGNCGNCNSTFATRDITTQAQMILSCVKRVRDHLGYSVGVTLIVQVLHGSREQRLLSLGLDRLSTYGLMREHTSAQIRTCIEELIAQGYLHIRPEHQTLEPTPRAAAVLFHGEQVSLSQRYQIAPQETKQRPKSTAPDQVDAALLNALKALRSRLAQEAHIPAYLVFSNAALSDMAARHPHTIEEFLEVSGVGEKKAAQYGTAFLAAIQAYEKGDDAL